MGMPGSETALEELMCRVMGDFIQEGSVAKWVVGWCDGTGSYNLDYSRARAYCTCNRCGWGLFGHFYSHLSFLSSFSLSLGDGPI